MHFDDTRGYTIVRKWKNMFKGVFFVMTVSLTVPTIYQRTNSIIDTVITAYLGSSQVTKYWQGDWNTQLVKPKAGRNYRNQ
jgi:hypothetical protein